MKGLMSCLTFKQGVLINLCIPCSNVYRVIFCIFARPGLDFSRPHSMYQSDGVGIRRSGRIVRNFAQHANYSHNTGWGEMGWAPAGGPFIDADGGQGGDASDVHSQFWDG